MDTNEVVKNVNIEEPGKSKGLIGLFVLGGLGLVGGAAIAIKKKLTGSDDNESVSDE